MCHPKCWYSKQYLEEENMCPINYSSYSDYGPLNLYKYREMKKTTEKQGCQHAIRPVGYIMLDSQPADMCLFYTKLVFVHWWASYTLVAEEKNKQTNKQNA